MCNNKEYTVLEGSAGRKIIRELKAAKYETQKPSTCRATLFRCKFLSMFPVFHLRDQLVVQQKHLLWVEVSCCEK